MNIRSKSQSAFLYCLNTRLTIGRKWRQATTGTFAALDAGANPEPNWPELTRWPGQSNGHDDVSRSDLPCSNLLNFELNC